MVGCQWLIREGRRGEGNLVGSRRGFAKGVVMEKNVPLADRLDLGKDPAGEQLRLPGVTQPELDDFHAFLQRIFQRHDPHGRLAADRALVLLQQRMKDTDEQLQLL